MTQSEADFLIKQEKKTSAVTGNEAVNSDDPFLNDSVETPVNTNTEEVNQATLDAAEAINNAVANNTVENQTIEMEIEDPQLLADALKQLDNLMGSLPYDSLEDFRSVLDYEKDNTMMAASLKSKLEQYDAELSDKIMTFGVQNLINTLGKPKGDPDFMLGDSEQNQKTQQVLANWAEVFKKTGKAPIFQDFWQSLVNVNGGNRAVWNSASLELMGENWTKAGLGESGWKDIWEDQYTDVDPLTAEIYANTPIFHITQSEAVSNAKADSRKNERTQENPPLNPITNKEVEELPERVVEEKADAPVDIEKEISSNSEKIATAESKGNYSSIQYEVDREKTNEGFYTEKVDAAKGIPTLKEGKHLDPKDLLHKNRNNPGDKLGIRVTTVEDWDNPKILVSTSHPNGNLKEVMVFSKWIEQNQGNLSKEAFMLTQKFLDKVPMFYTGIGAKGTTVDLMYIPDTDWHNPLSTADPSRETDAQGKSIRRETVDRNNPTQAHLDLIQEGKDNARKLRGQINDGSVETVTIKSKEGSRWVMIPEFDAQGTVIPPKKLKDVAKDNKIIQFNGVTFLDLEKQGLSSDIAIKNQSDLIKRYKKKQSESKDGNISAQNYYLSPINKENGKQYFMAMEILQKNDNGDMEAFEEDVTTARLIMGAQEVLSRDKEKHGISLKQAEQIRQAVLKATKNSVDIRSGKAAQSVVASMITMRGPLGKVVAYDTTKDSETEFDKDGKPKKEGIYFVDALFSPEYTPSQNVRINPKKRLALKVEFKELGVNEKGEMQREYSAEQIGETYDDYLKQRLSSAVMGYNMGTEQDPAFTFSVQPVIKVTPNIDPSKRKSTQEVEKTEPTFTPKKNKDTGSIEERRQEELDRYADDIVVSREIYEMTNEEGETTYVEIRIMKDGSRKVSWGMNIKDTKNNKDVVTGNYDSIPKGLSIDTWLETMFDETTFGKPTLRLSDSNPIFKREDKINAKYDAEVAALDIEVEEEDLGIKETTKEVSQEDLDKYDKIADVLRKYNALNKLDNSDALIPSLDDVDLIEEALNNIAKLSLEAQNNIIKKLSTIITEQYVDKAMSIGDLHTNSKPVFDKIFQDAVDSFEASLVQARELVAKYPNEDSFQVIAANLEISIEDNKKVLDKYDTFFTRTVSKVQKENLVPIAGKNATEEEIEQELQDHQDAENNDKNFYKSANEDIHKTKIGPELKKIFYNISSGKTGFMGIDIPMDYDYVYNMVATYLATSKNTVPTFDGMIAELEKIDVTKDTWVTELITKLKEAPEKARNGFVSNMYKHAANAKFIMFQKDKERVTGAVWFSNANNIDQKIRESWKQNYQRSPLESGNILNSEALKAIKEEFDDKFGEWSEGKDSDGARKWLANFGIVLSDNTWKDLIKGNLVIPEKGIKVSGMPFSSLFVSAAKGRSSSLFDNLYKYAKLNMGKKDENLNYVTNKKLLPFAEMGNILKGLIPLEIKHNKSLINITRRDGDKTVSEIIYPSFYIENMNKLINSANGDKKDIRELQATAFSRSSLLLDVLAGDNEMGEIFDYGEVGLMSMRNQFKDKPDYSNIDQISPIDYVFHQRQMFQDLNTDKIAESRDGFELRIATMSTPTNSDKGRMMLMKTVVYDFFKTPQFAFDMKTPKLEFKNELKEILFKRLVEPELDRILTHRNRDIKGYDAGGMRFNLMPSLNTLTNEAGVPAITYLENLTKADKVDEAAAKAFKDDYFDVFTAEIEEIGRASCRERV